MQRSGPRTAVFGRRRWLLVATTLTGLALGSACKDRAPARADGTILTPYLAIGEVLADDEIEGVARLGAEVVAASDRQAEAPGVVEILAAAGRIGASDISTARLAYRKMSEGMIAYLAAHPEQREGLILVHCPMTFANEGAYWVQRGETLRNPYEGAMMLRCGAKIAWDDHRRGGPPAGEAQLEGMDK